MDELFMFKEKDSIKKIWISPYILVEKLTRKKHEGLLLKVLFSYSGIGYSQIHPFEQQKETSLSDSISLLKECISKNTEEKNIRNMSIYKNFNLLNLSLQIAKEDAQARLQNKSLFFNYSPLESHYLISDIRLLKNIPSDFSILKIKMGSQLGKETDLLRKTIEELMVNIRFRLDFNEKLSKKNWQKWEKENQDLAAYIDFIEDPFYPFNFIPSVFSLAQDWSQTHYCPVRVIKGSRYHLSDVCRFLARFQAQRFIFTHSLTHPLEARISYLKACQFYKIHPQKKEVCGLHYDLHFYEPNDFSRYYSKNQFYSSLGTGLGFDDLWLRQKWTLI